MEREVIQQVEREMNQRIDVIKQARNEVSRQLKFSKELLVKYNIFEKIDYIGHFEKKTLDENGLEKLKDKESDNVKEYQSKIEEHDKEINIIEKGLSKLINLPFLHAC